MMVSVASKAKKPAAKKPVEDEENTELPDGDASDE
jgi:hypothetical protein